MQDRNGVSGHADLTALYQTATRFDCGFLLDFHCYNMFGHTQPDALPAHRRSEFAATAHSDILWQSPPRPKTFATEAPEGFSDGDAFIEPQPISHVEQGLAGDMAQFLYRTWLKNKGVVFGDSELTRLCPWLLLTLPGAPQGEVPHVTFVGKQSNFLKFYPQALDDLNHVSPAACLPDGYRHAIAEAYHWTMQGEPNFDIQRTGQILGESLPDMTLQRLLLRFETKTGFTRIFSLVTLVEMHSRPFSSNRSDHHRWRRDGLSWHPAYQVSGARPGARRRALFPARSPKA
ncbi:hypothetical protein [Roseibium sp.]|uniref:hypothetical protein n=1 Tax=Roseibium sp. TaxID=1936156 RepID=UPI003BAEC3DF